MIIVCSECQAQYSVADSKVRGRKVRVTCKHCGHGIIVDGFALDAAPAPKPAPAPPPAPAPAPAPFETVPAIFDALRVAPEDDATRVMRKPQDFSVHDEPTVVGRIPQEALEAERRFSQSTVPPPKDGEPAAPIASAAEPSLEPPPHVPAEPSQSPPGSLSPPSSLSPVSSKSPPSSLPPDVMEQLLDSTQAASPRAIASSRPSPAPAANADGAARGDAPSPALWPWVVGAILIVIALAALAIRH